MEYRINGFDQIKALYSIVFSQKHDFTPHHISLYVFLINQNNRNEWVEWFKCPYDLAMAGACIGNKKTYYKCLNDLQEWGLLEYKKGVNEWKAPKIKLEVLKCTSSVPQSVPLPEPLPTTLPEPLPTTQVGININHKPKTINLKPKTENSDIFDLFWNSYHEITGKTKTDLQAAKKHWLKLTDAEMAKAVANIKPYYDSISDKKYIKKARTYLSDKNFNDEFKTEIKSNGEINLKDFNIPTKDHFGYSQDMLLEFCKQGKYQRL